MMERLELTAMTEHPAPMVMTERLVLLVPTESTVLMERLERMGLASRTVSLQMI